MGWAGGGAELERAERSSRRRMADGGDGEQDRAEQSEREGEKEPVGSTTLARSSRTAQGWRQSCKTAAGSELELVNGDG